MSDTHEIQNREKHRAGDADHPAVCPKGVFGAVSDQDFIRLIEMK